MTGIYRITNTKTDEGYIGQSCDIERRFSEHLTPKNMLKSGRLCAAMREYGKESFRLDVLELCEIDELCAREIHYIALLQPEYNISRGGKGNLGHVVTEEIRQLLSFHGKAQWESMTAEHKAHVIAHQLRRPEKGRKISEQTKQKLRLANLGKKQPPEVGMRISAALKGRPKDNSFNKKPVEQIDIKTGVVLNVYPSVNDAAMNIGRHPAAISSVLIGRQATAGGYAWRISAIKCRD